MYAQSIKRQGTNVIPLIAAALALLILALVATALNYDAPTITPQVDEYTRSLCDEYITLIDNMRYGMVEDYHAAEAERSTLHSQIADAIGVDHQDLTTELIRSLYLENKADGQNATDNDE